MGQLAIALEYPIEGERNLSKDGHEEKVKLNLLRHTGEKISQSADTGGLRTSEFRVWEIVGCL